MKMRRALPASVMTAFLVWGGAALAESPSDVCLAHEKARATAPKKIEGTIMKVDPAGGKVTIQETNGKVHEFRAPPETLQSMKAGDHIEANLRPTC
jgi:Cu/Ag efflux protein CusF